MLLFEKGDYLFSFDLKSGYHHVDIAEVHQKYLGFSWWGCYYVLTVLLFGLSTACYMFTKLLRPLVRYWHSKGLRLVVYLDDGLGASAGRARANWISLSYPTIELCVEFRPRLMLRPLPVLKKQSSQF